MVPVWLAERLRARTVAAWFALAMGVAFVLAAVGGFLPLVTTVMPHDAPHLHLTAASGLLLGLFPVNVAHNLAHLVFGIAGLVAARSATAARRYCRWLAVALLVFTLLGAVPSWSTAGGLLPLWGHAVWLHLLEALAAAWLGFAPLGGRTMGASSWSSQRAGVEASLDG